MLGGVVIFMYSKAMDVQCGTELMNQKMCVAFIDHHAASGSRRKYFLLSELKNIFSDSLY